VVCSLFNFQIHRVEHGRTLLRLATVNRGTQKKEMGIIS
jgi:hypothetical protein